MAHKNLPLKGATGQVQALKILEVLEEYNSKDTILAVLLDNTAVNTGFKGGIVAWLEKSLERKLHLNGCTLHQNELPFRAVFLHLYETTKNPQAFNGPIGKLASKENIHLDPTVDFEPISPGSESLNLPDEVVSDLSTDQQLMYEYWVGITTGKMRGNFAQRKIGPVMHARCFTLATRILCLYTKTKTPSENLKNLTQYIIQVYTLTWFLIKKSSSFHTSPSILFEMIQQIKKQDEVIRQICLKNLSKNSYCLLPEIFVYCLLKTDDIETREEGLKVVKKVRAAKKAIPRITNLYDLQINFDAGRWQDLIDLSIATEPAVTQIFEDQVIIEHLMSGEPLDLPDFPSHAQSVERAVKLVSEASSFVYGLEARHKYILTKVKRRKLRPAFKSKSEYTFNYQ